jgi:hypothetical protein
MKDNGGENGREIKEPRYKQIDPTFADYEETYGGETIAFPLKTSENNTEILALGMHACFLIR